MTVEKFLEDIKTANITKKIMPQKRFARFIRQFEYVDVYTYWYDDDENPDLNIWVDIEGIGYGWIWCSYKKSKKKQRKAIIKFAKEIFEYSKKEKMGYEYYNNIYHFYLESKDEASITLIRCSHNELDWW